MAILNSPFTISQNAVMRSYRSLMASSAGHIRSIPSRPGNAGVSKPEASPYENLEEFEVSWAETIRQVHRGWFSEDTIKEVRESVRKSLDTGSPTVTNYDIYFHINSDGEVHIDSILPAKAPTIGNQTNFRYYKERIAVNTPTPDKLYTDLDPLVKEIEKKVNKEYIFKQDKEKFEKDIKDIPERVLRNINEYKDPPTEERLIDIGSMS